ncbi:MAG: ABC transporter ATP-binding protein [Bacteroidaceae bacterium]|nr:ABC transporter ATP-binding protein [Bacteroidaceae bacterium]
MKLNKTKYTFKQIANWLWKHHKGCRTQMIVNVVVGLIQVFIGLYYVEILRQVTDIATHEREGNLWMMIAIFGTIFVVEIALSVLTTWLRAVLSVRSQNKMQRMFFSRLLNGHWNGIEKYHSGDILNRLFGDVSDIISLLTEVLPSLVSVIAQFIFSFLYLYTLDSTMALMLIIASPFFVLLSRFYFRKMRRIVRKIKDSNSALQAIIQESVQHKMVVKVLERGGLMVSRLERRQALLHWQIKARAKFSIYTKVIINLGFSGTFLVGLAWGLYQVHAGIITIGVLMAYTQLINRIQRPLLDIAHMLPVFVNSLTSSERLMELEELPLEEQEPNTKLDGKVGVRFEHVDYQYTAEGRKVLDDFSYDFKPGSFTAILGETGAGKTTLIRLMLALMDTNKGRAVLYNDQRELVVGTGTRCNFSYVPQGNTLFSGTIRENLLFGNPDATIAQMHEALRIAKADFVLELPEGIDTKCGESGGGLSEGQAQRITIARAILRPCKVLLLDEATSALDIETEHSLLENIKAHFKDTTIIFVTHRLAVVGFTSDQLHMKRQ